jgi:hypothetical protein
LFQLQLTRRAKKEQMAFFMALSYLARKSTFGEKAMRKPNAIVPDRRRNIRQCTFGWIDHNFLHRGFLGRLSQEELLLYYFLITVADRNGVSFYDYERICQLLKLELADYLRARDRLCERSLIAYHDGVFQVLALPQDHTVKPILPEPRVRSATGDFQALHDVLNNLNR